MLNEKVKMQSWGEDGAKGAKGVKSVKGKRKRGRPLADRPRFFVRGINLKFYTLTVFVVTGDCESIRVIGRFCFVADADGAVRK